MLLGYRDHNKTLFQELLSDVFEKAADGAREVDLATLGEGSANSFRNHDLLNSMIIREDHPIERVLLSHDLEFLYYLTDVKVGIRQLKDIHEPFVDISEYKNLKTIATAPNSM